MVALFSGIASVGARVAMPYTTSDIMRVGLDEAAHPADAAGFSLGALTWDLRTYQAAPTLQQFRDLYLANCPGQTGVAAAGCLTKLIAAKSPIGLPRTEFVDATYDPVAQLARHLAGGSGHCMSRSALVATGLLANGIPARVVQLLPAREGGHNVIEVWDQGGWVLFDGLFDARFIADGKALSAVELTTASGDVASSPAGPLAQSGNSYRGATLSYPEPWLYTRVGERCARWPFRGCFAQTGPKQFLLGPAQSLAFSLGLVSALAALICLAMIVAALARRPRPAPSTEPAESPAAS